MYEYEMRQVNGAIDSLHAIIADTDWSILFPNTDNNTTFIEAKAKVLEGIKKFETIKGGLLKSIDNEQSK